QPEQRPLSDSVGERATQSHRSTDWLDKHHTFREFHQGVPWELLKTLHRGRGRPTQLRRARVRPSKYRNRENRKQQFWFATSKEKVQKDNPPAKPHSFLYRKKLPTNDLHLSALGPNSHAPRRARCPLPSRDLTSISRFHFESLQAKAAVPDSSLRRPA